MKNRTTNYLTRKSRCFQQLSVSIVLLLLMAAEAFSADPGIVKTDLFKAGDHGYSLYHIPGVAVTSKGKILAWCEARKNAGRDWDDIDILLRRSTDDGVSWSRPVEITKTFEAFRKDYDWKVLATGPNHGIQLRRGRLLVPVWLSTGTGGNAHRPSVTATIFSDDGGTTWQASEIAIPCTDKFVNPNETVAVELADGRVILNARNESKARRRIVVTSPDGTTEWSQPRFQDDLVDPVCMGGLTHYDHNGKPLLLFSNPNTLKGRRNVTVRVSEDEGKTWPIFRSVEPGYSCYSDINVTPQGTIVCFYGRGEKPSFAGDRLTLARFTLDCLYSK